MESVINQCKLELSVNQFLVKEAIIFNEDKLLKNHKKQLKGKKKELTKAYKEISKLSTQFMNR